MRDRLTGRLPGGLLALAGVLLVTPTLVEPTWRTTVADREHGSLLSQQWEWSWGRVRQTGIEGVELQDRWNALPLAVAVVLLAVGLAGAVAWSVPRLRVGPVLALAGVGLLAGRVLTSVTARVGQVLEEVDRSAAGLTVRTETTSAGTAETLGALVLVLALGAMLLSVLVAVRRAARSGGPAGAPDASGPVVHPPDARPSGTRPTRGEASAGLRPPGEHLSGPVVDLVEEERP